MDLNKFAEQFLLLGVCIVSSVRDKSLFTKCSSNFVGIFVGLKERASVFVCGDQERCRSYARAAASLGHSFDKILGLLQSWVALVLELEFVVEEARVLLEVVRLAIEEGVQFFEVAGIFGLALC